MPERAAARLAAFSQCGAAGRPVCVTEVVTRSVMPVRTRSYETEQLPEAVPVTFGDASNTQDLSGYDAFVVPVCSVRAITYHDGSTMRLSPDANGSLHAPAPTTASCS